MELRLYNFPKKHNSTKQLLNDAQPVATYTNVYLKQSTDIDAPTFLIDDSLLDVNYAYLVDLGRFYFINGMRLGNNNIFEIECDLDALATYKAYIIAYEAFVERCADPNYYRDYFNDELVSVSQRVNNYDMTLGSISQFSSGGTYVLRIAGGDADGISTYVSDRIQDFANIFDQDNYLTSAQTEWWEKLGSTLVDPMSYVVAFYWSPITLSYYQQLGAYQAYIWVKWYDTQALAYKLPNNTIAQFTVEPPQPAALYSDFRKYNPCFTQYKMLIPTVGLVDINNNDASSGVYVAFTINLDTGATCVVLSRKSDLTKIATYEGNLYVAMQTGSDRVTLGNMLGGAMVAVSAIKSKDIVGGSVDMINAATNILAPTPTMIGSNGGIGVRAINNVYFISICYGSGEIPTKVAGRPCYRNLVLSNLSGFVKCGAPSLELPADDSITNRVNAMLEEGIYLE